MMLVDVSNVTTTLPPFCCKMTYRIWELPFLTMTKWADILYHFYQVMFLFDPFIQDFNNILFIQPVKSKPFLIFSWINYYMMRHLINVFIHLFNIFTKLDIENPIIRINTAFKGCSSLEKISVLPRIYHN